MARQLAAAGSPQRLLVRDAGRAPELEGAVPVVVTYADPVRRQSGPRAGWRRSSWSPPPRPRTGCSSTAPLWTRRPLPACSTSSTPRSSARQPDSTFTLGRDHFATEERIKASGMDYTFLRDNFYLDFLPLAGRRGRRHPRTGRRRRDGSRGPGGRRPLRRDRAPGPGPARRQNLRPHRAGGHLPGPRPRNSSPPGPAGPSRSTTRPSRRPTPRGPPMARRRGRWTPG